MRTKTITFECEIITPMFLGDATNGAELRPPAIKAGLRFWWRAMNAHLPLTQLREKETAIFGGGGEEARKSSIEFVSFSTKVEKENKPKLPHKINAYERAIHKSLKTKEIFTLELRITDESIFSYDKLEALMFVASTLGNLGARARRGMGAWQIRKVDNTDCDDMTLTELLEYIKLFNTNYRLDITVESTGGILNEDYPYIKSIEIGGNTFDDVTNLLKKVMIVAHNEKHNQYFNDAIGSFRPRLASPIYISVLKVATKKYKLLITKLNTPGLDDRAKNYQIEFIKKIIDLK